MFVNILLKIRIAKSVSSQRLLELCAGTAGMHEETVFTHRKKKGIFSVDHKALTWENESRYAAVVQVSHVGQMKALPHSLRGHTYTARELDPRLFLKECAPKETSRVPESNARSVPVHRATFEAGSRKKLTVPK